MRAVVVLAFDFGNAGNRIKATELVGMAVEQAQNALKVGENGSAYYNYTTSLFYLNRFQEAKKAIEKAIERGETIDPGFVDEIDRQFATSNSWF